MIVIDLGRHCSAWVTSLMEPNKGYKQAFCKRAYRSANSWKSKKPQVGTAIYADPINASGILKNVVVCSRSNFWPQLYHSSSFHTWSPRICPPCFPLPCQWLHDITSQRRHSPDYRHLQTKSARRTSNCKTR